MRAMSGVLAAGMALGPSTLASGVLAPDVAVNVTLGEPRTAGQLGAAQGVEWRDGHLYLYGDGRTGLIREYDLVDDATLRFTGREVRLTVGARDRVPHPTGLTVHRDHRTWLGNSVGAAGRLYQLDWAKALAGGTLDAAIRHVTLDDLAVNGTRPEFVRLASEWLVATADYGTRHNAVRLYDPARLATAVRTSAAGVLVATFPCGPWVQNLHWIDERGLLVLVQNQVEGRRWRLSFIDLEQSVNAGQAIVRHAIDLRPPDELEGFTLIRRDRGILVSSSGHDNVRFARIAWPAG